jgi:hypothetical protein
LAEVLGATTAWNKTKSLVQYSSVQFITVGE